MRFFPILIFKFLKTGWEIIYIAENALLARLRYNNFSLRNQPIFKLLRIFIPYTIRTKYENQEKLEYTFVTKDGSIELSKFALQHSDFYREQCEGPDSF